MKSRFRLAYGFYPIQAGSVPRILHRADPQREHTPLVHQGDSGVPGLVRRSRRPIAGSDHANPCRRVDRGDDRDPFGANRKATAGGRAAHVRLAGDRSRHANQSGALGAGSEAFASARKDPRAIAGEARQLLDSIPTDTLIGQRDRALIGLMTYTFARIGAATGMEVRDVYAQNHRLSVRLHEKGGKQVELPCHHTLEAYLDDDVEATGLKDTPRAPLF